MERTEEGAEAMEQADRQATVTTPSQRHVILFPGRTVEPRSDRMIADRCVRDIYRDTRSPDLRAPSRYHRADRWS